MQSTSDAFNEAITESHKLACRVTLTDTQGNETELDVLDGTVTLDGTAATRGQCSLTLSPDTEIPDTPTSILAPYGSEIAVMRGVTFPSGDTEMVPLGVFRIDETDVSDTGDIDLQVSALDRSARIIEAVFEDAGQIAQGTNCADQIQDFIYAAFPDVVYDSTESVWDDVTTTTPLLGYPAGGDRWDTCLALAEAAQCELFFNAVGELVLRYRPSATIADYVVSEGTVLLSASKRWGRESACNRVVVEGANATDTPVFGEASDDDPLSPTYYGGDFGKVTFNYSSEYITDSDQANSVADIILRQKKGTGQQIGFTSLVLPQLEPGDCVEVIRERLGISELHVIDSLQIPLGPGEMSATTRSLQVV